MLIPPASLFGSQSRALARRFASSFAINSSSSAICSSSSASAALNPSSAASPGEVASASKESSPRSSAAAFFAFPSDACIAPAGFGSVSIFFSRALRRSSRRSLRDFLPPPNHPLDFASTSLLSWISPSAPHVNESAVTGSGSGAGGAAHPQSPPRSFFSAASCALRSANPASILAFSSSHFLPHSRSISRVHTVLVLICTGLHMRPRALRHARCSSRSCSHSWALYEQMMSTTPVKL